MAIAGELALPFLRKPRKAQAGSRIESRTARIDDCTEPLRFGGPSDARAARFTSSRVIAITLGIEEPAAIRKESSLTDGLSTGYPGGDGPLVRAKSWGREADWADGHRSTKWASCRGRQFGQ